MAAKSPLSVEPPLLLFCDTFSHQENEEMHLDLVSFPRPVAIQEVRVIPAGHRVHAAISDREKIGETHPSSFKLDMFIRNLDNPGAVVFERLGVLDYKEPNHFQITASVKAATDVVVLRGWYTRITISLYGYFTEISRPMAQETRTDKHSERPSVIMEPRPQDRDQQPTERTPEKMERGYQRTYDRAHDRAPPEKVPERAERRERSFERGTYERGSDRGSKSSDRDEYEGRRDEERRSRAGSRESEDNIRPSRKQDVDPRQRSFDDDSRPRSSESFPEEARRARGRPRDDSRSRQGDIEGRGRRYNEGEERRSRSKDRTPAKSPPPRRRSSKDSPEKVIATVGESTAAKPTTPPGSPREEAEESGSRSGSHSDDLFEPLTPDHSPNMFLSDEGADDEEQDAYEEILSDEEDMNLDDGAIDETGVQFGDLDLYSEDAWMSVSVSFNPYQCDLSPLTSFPAPDQTEHEAALHKFKDAATTETAKDTGEKLVELVELCKVYPRNSKWVEVLEEIPPLITPGLAYVMRTKEDSDVTLTSLIEWTMFALNMDEAMRLPIAVNVRMLKVALRMVHSLCNCGPTIAALLINAGVQEKLHDHLTCEHMSSSMKLHALQALDSSTDSHIGLEHFLGWDTASKEEDDDDVDMTDSNDEETQSGYQKLMEFLLTDQTVRVVDAASALGRKVHFYELLASFQSAVERVMKTTAETAAAAQDFDGESEQEPGTESKEPKTPPHDMFSMEMQSMSKPLKEGGANSDDTEVIALALDEIYAVLDNAVELIAQPPIKSFPTTAKITAIGFSVKDPYPVLFRLFAVRRLLESIVVLMSSVVGCHPLVYCGIRDLIFLLLQSHRGLLFLSSHPETVGGLIRVLTQTTESDIHHSEAPPLQEFLRDSTTADLCTSQHLGLLLIYHLQTLQAVDQLVTSLSNGISATDLDGADTLSTLHTLYSMTFTMIGKAAVVQVMSMDNNLSSLLPFVKPTGDPTEDVKLKKCVSSRYASVLILLTIKCSDNVEILSKLSSQLLTITEKTEADSPLTELRNWLDPLKDFTFDTSSITKLVEYVQSKLSTLNTSHEVACGVLTALRILRHLVCPEKDEQQKSQGHQKDLNVNLSCIQLFSANAMDIFINTLQKLGEFVLHPWRKGQPLGTGHPLVTISMATPLLALLKRMLIELLDKGTYQFKDTRLMTSLMLIHTVMCSAPMTGQLNSLAQQIQSDIVAIFMTFTRPIVQSSDHEEAINESIWSLMLKELFKYITSTPQAFLGGLVLLSELLPVPLPMHTLEDLQQEGISQVMNHRLLWSAHLNPLSSDLQGILKSLSVSACHNLQQILRRVCSQLADLSAPTAFNIVRTLLEVLNNEMSKPSEEDKKTCTADAIRIMALLAFLSSQPAVKISLLQLLKISRAGKNDDVMFPNLLPSMLAMLSAEPDAVTVSRAQYCVVSIIQSLCDPSVSLTSFVTPYTNQHLANTLPDSEMLSIICTALLDHVGSTNQSFATILLALRSMVTLTAHNYGVYHLKRSLESNTEVFHQLLQRLSSSFETGIPGPDSLSTLSTTTELLQLLLPEEATAEESQPVDSQSETIKTESDSDVTKPVDEPVKQELPEVEPADGREKTEEIVKTENTEQPAVSSITLKKEELFGLTDDAELKPTSEISVSVEQMKMFLKADSEDEFSLRVLEKHLEESCKEDETLDTLLDGITTLKQILEKGDDTDKDVEEDKEPDLPSAHPFQQLFSNRVTYIADPEEGGVSPTLWFSTPPPDDIDPETDMVTSDLDSLRTKYCPDFDLAAELEKGVVPSPPSSPIRKKSRVVKRKFDPLIHDGNKEVKRFRGGYGRGRGRGMGRGRGRGASDLFRSRKQNTSRPPSMHVDDFMAMEQQHNKGQDNMSNRRAMEGPMTSRSPMDRGGPNFPGSQNRWGGLSGPFRKGPGPQGMGRGGGTPDWISQRQFGGFPDQRGFQRGPNWSNPQQSQYRGGGMRDNQYSRPQGRGYWESPRTTKADIDGRFMTSPHVGTYRPGAGRGYQGRHLRSFTR